MRRTESGDGAEQEERHRRSKSADQEGREDRESKNGAGKRIDLSVAQVAGAGMATLTAATAASYLNVYGTVIGTAVMAVLSTSATPVIQHWITRSGEQAKELAGKAKVPQGHDLSEGADPAMECGRESPDDATRTMALPTLGQNLPGQTLAHGFGNPADPKRPHDPIPDETIAFPSQGSSDDPDLVENVAEDGEARSKRGRRAVLIPAGVVFVLVMLVILAFELLTGRSLTAWTQGQDEPTSPSILGGHSAPAQPEEEPTTEPEGEREPQDTSPGTGPGADTEEPGTPGGVPGDQDTDGPTSPTVPTDPPTTGSEPGRPEGPIDPGDGGGGQGEDVPQDGVPQEGGQSGSQGESAPSG